MYLTTIMVLSKDLQAPLLALLYSLKEYTGEFKPSKKLYEFLKGQGEKKEMRDHWNLKARSEAPPNFQAYRDKDIHQRININPKNIIEFHLQKVRVSTYWGLWSKEAPALIIGIVPGELNRDEDFSEDSRQKYGSAYIALGYVFPKIDYNQLKDLLNHFINNKDKARTNFLEMVRGLRIETAAGNAFYLGEYYGEIESYDLQIKIID